MQESGGGGDVLAFEQPSAAQKFSAQEFLNAFRFARKERNEPASHAGCSKVSTSRGEKKIRATTSERTRTTPQERGHDEGFLRGWELSIVTVFEES